MTREKKRVPLMKAVFIFIWILGVSQIQGTNLHQIPDLTRKYFGQKAPGSKAELFAPRLISLDGRYEFALSFSPKGDELLFSAGIPDKPVCVYYTKISDGKWGEPKPVSLSKGAKKEEMEAFFSWDGRHIFFAPYDEGLDVRIWKVDIQEDGWKNPVPLRGNISDESAFYPTSSKKGTLYYFNIAQKKIYRALLDKGVVKESGDAGLEFGGHCFIAPDESFMLVDANQPDSRGKLDIYVVFRREDGGWSKPVNLGDEVNTEHNETCPTLSSDGKYLFFSRYNEPGELSNIYWVDAKIIEELNPINRQENENIFGIADSYPIPGSCTIFSASFGNTVLYGNNEDYRIPKTYYWTEPSSEKAYGGVFLGFDNFSPQGGINEKGLAFDFNALPEAPLKPHPELPGRGDIIKKIYQTCATVEEAIALAKKHNWGSSIRWQVLLADATGDAVVISAGPDRELAFTRKPKGDRFLVSTNFNRANPKNTYRGGYPCWRYDKAVEILDKIEHKEDLTVDRFKSILDACHVEGPVGNTLYSNVFDLKNGIIYLYYWHQFYETAVLKVAEEITKNKPPTRIKELFSQETVKQAEDEFQKYKKTKGLRINERGKTLSNR
jgi:hypothetical protein